MKNSFVFYKDWVEALSELSDAERLEAYEAIFRFAFEGVKPEDRLIRIATASIFKSISRDNDKFEEKCERNRRNVMQRWKKLENNGNTTANGDIRSNTTNTENENGKENENEKENTPTTKVVGDIDKEKASKEVKKKAATPTRFVKPTVEQVESYCKERGNFVNAQSFVDFYESKGWVVGKSPMKDWKAAVRTWEQKNGGRRKPVSQSFKLGQGEWIENGVRYYGSGRVVPLSAPPRPDAISYWSEESKSWVSGV